MLLSMDDLIRLKYVFWPSKPIFKIALYGLMSSITCALSLSSGEKHLRFKTYFIFNVLPFSSSDNARTESSKIAGL